MCLTPSLAVAAVEIAHLAGADMGGADRQPRRALIDQIEIDQFGQRLLQRRGRVVAGAVGAERIAVAGMGQRVGPEEAGNAVGHRRPVGQLFVEARKDVAKTPDRILLHPLPEFAQPRQPVLRRIAGDQAGVDGADRGADDPVRLDAGLVQRLIDAGLIGAERAAALQHQHDLARQSDLASDFDVRRRSSMSLMSRSLRCCICYVAISALLRRVTSVRGPAAIDRQARCR